MEERVFLDSGNVSISLSRFIVDGQTYAMSGVTSVRTGHAAPSRIGPILLAVFGVLFLFAASALMMVLGTAMVVLAIYVWANQKPTYIVMLSSASGEAKALSSPDRLFIGNVVNALNDCIVARG
jgi:hypothetical protein